MASAPWGVHRFEAAFMRSPTCLARDSACPLPIGPSGTLLGASSVPPSVSRTRIPSAWSTMSAGGFAGDGFAASIRTKGPWRSFRMTAPTRSLTRSTVLNEAWMPTVFRGSTPRRNSMFDPASESAFRSRSLWASFGRGKSFSPGEKAAAAAAAVGVVALDPHGSADGLGGLRSPRVLELAAALGTALGAIRGRKVHRRREDRLHDTPRRLVAEDRGLRLEIVEVRERHPTTGALIGPELAEPILELGE